MLHINNLLREDLLTLYRVKFASLTAAVISTVLIHHWLHFDTEKKNLKLNNSEARIEASSSHGAVTCVAAD